MLASLASEKSTAELKKLQRKERKAALKAQAKAKEEKKGEERRREGGEWFAAHLSV